MPGATNPASLSDLAFEDLVNPAFFLWRDERLNDLYAVMSSGMALQLLPGDLRSAVTLFPACLAGVRYGRSRQEDPDCHRF